MANIGVSALVDLFLTIVDVGSGRKIVTNANAFSFVGGEGGKQFVNYPYQFNERSTIAVTFRNAGAARLTVNAAIFGQYFKGVVS